jgi:murein DD-endopeptidase MepM/ murein hydrolase activator NlpD
MLKQMDSSELDCVKLHLIMSSKAEKTSNSSHECARSIVFYRNPLLLKIVAWLGGLSFLTNTGVACADIQPISASPSGAKEIIAASTAIGTNAIAREVYGPYLPTLKQPLPVTVAADRLPNREVPTAVTPVTASTPTGTLARPQHTDLTAADNITVSVNDTTDKIEIVVPAPLSKTIPARTAEVATMTRTQVQPKFERIKASILPTTEVGRSSNATISQSVPKTSIQAPTAKAPATKFVPQVVPLAGLRNTTVAPLKPSTLPGRAISQPQSKPATDIMAIDTVAVQSVEISVPPPRTRQIVVRPVAPLPVVSANRNVPSVPAIPTVRPASANSGQIAFANNSVRTIYPLTAPAPTTSSYGWRTHPITGSRRFHSGIDIGAPMGAPVVAAGSGTIVSAGWQGGYGKTIVIQHNGVQQTLYGHLSEIFVQPGQRIEQGMLIGRVGSTGNSTGPHLHYEMRMSTADGWVAVDPGEEIKYALEDLRRTMPFAQKDLPPGYN